MSELTILTPCYNRLTRVKKLLKSLENQTSFDFQWLVIDDGSTDGTKQWFEQLNTSFYSFEVDYYYKENGGKHTALNYSHQFIKGKYIVIVDSDDILIDRAVEMILTYWEKYADNKKISGITFQRGYLTTYQKFDTNITNTEKSTFAEMTNKGMSGDHCETFRSDLFKSKKFPVFKNENFVAEGAMWYLITKNYYVIYVDEIIYLAEYLDGGLTRSGRKLRITNPKGSQWHAEVFLDSEFNFKIRLKNALLFDTYSHFTNVKWSKAVVNTFSSRLMLAATWLPSYILYYTWKSKYGY